MNKIKLFAAFMFLLIIGSAAYGQSERRIISLGWEDVVGQSLKENESLESKTIDYKIQNLEYLRAYSNFLPELSYQGMVTHNIEAPQMPNPFYDAANPQSGPPFLSFATEYNYQHSLVLNYPIFTGGMRLFNIRMQSELQKSLKEELSGMKNETALSALSAYFGAILSEQVEKSNKDAVEAAKENLDQVQKFFDAGSATSLDLQRAKAQYYSTLPAYETALNSKRLAYQNLKFILNLSLTDSLIVRDSLAQMSFLKEYQGVELMELKELAADNRPDLKALSHRADAVDEGEKIALGSFLPTIALSYNITKQAQLDSPDFRFSDFSMSTGEYLRSKALTVSINWPLFQGGKRLLDYQKARLQTKQVEIALNQGKDQAEIDVERSYYGYQEAVKNLNALQEAMLQSKESLRLANLLFSEGMSVQKDVLDAQLLYTQSTIQYLQGIYNYNISQLSLLNSIGLIKKIWE